MDKLYIVIPAYNESENILQVIEEWYEIVEKYHGNGTSRLVVIDDGSKDNTFEIMEKCAKEKPLFVPLKKNNSGHGATLLFGYQFALDNEADYIFQTDSDGQTLADEFHQFWSIREQHDMVIGWRNARADGFSRVFVTKVLKLVLFICFGVSIVDANTPYRLMKVETLRRYIGRIPKDFNLSNVLISVLFKKFNCNVKYIPITFRERQGGVNSINMKKIYGIGKKALKDFYNINKALK